MKMMISLHAEEKKLVDEEGGAARGSGSRAGLPRRSRTHFAALICCSGGARGDAHAAPLADTKRIRRARARSAWLSSSEERARTDK